MLSGEERLNEMTRMLGGVELTKKTREHAREMLERAGRKGM
jgi:DNA repair protein RecN (Recombination protein N)